MALYKIQAYNEEMTKLVSEYNKEFKRTEDALVEAYAKADSEDIVVLWRQSVIDPKCWRRIAKFY